LDFDVIFLFTQPSATIRKQTTHERKKERKFACEKI